MGKDANISSSVEKGVLILETLANSKNELSANELAELCHIPRPTVYRYIHTWEKLGYVDFLDDGTYGIGTKIIKIARTILDNMDLRIITKPILRELRVKTDETINLIILEEDHIFYLGNFESTHTLRAHSKMGTTDPLHSTASGKVLLAFLPKPEKEAILENLTLSKVTPQTITDKKILQDELKKIRKVGYALDLEENEIDIHEISAPIFDLNDQVSAAISVIGPSSRLGKPRIQEMAPLVVKAATNISRLLGHNPETKGHIPL